MLFPHEVQTVRQRRGRNEWPCFRDYTPGLIPWFLNGPQCVTLTHVLHQATQVALECKKAKTTDILFGPDDELFLRVPEKTTEGLAWSLCREPVRVASAATAKAPQAIMLAGGRTPLAALSGPEKCSRRIRILCG